MSPVKLLYLSYDGLTDPLGQSQILPYLCGLARRGYLITIISFEKPLRFNTLKNDITLICDSHNVRWVPLRYHKKPAIISTVYDLFILRKVVSKYIKQEGCKIVHCRSYLVSIIGLFAKKKWKAKFIFDMRGFWADERVEGGLWNVKNPIYRIVYLFFKKKEKIFLKEADYAISLTESAKQEILSWKLSVAPISVIPTCVDLDLFNPENIKNEDKEKLRDQLGIKRDDFVLLYLGSWGTWYMTEEMLSFFSNLKGQKKKAKFLIVSTDKINLNGYPDANDVIIISAARKMVPLYISLADISVFFIKPSFSKKASSATKMAEILAMNVPVITNPGWGDVNLLSLKSLGKITLVNLDSFGNFDKDFTNFRAREYCLEEFSLEKGISSYEYVYKTVMHL